MANTDHTRTTRRAILTGIAATAAATAVPAQAGATIDAEAVLAAWRAWRPLEEEDWALCAELKDAYKRYPQAFIPPGVLVCDVNCMTAENIDEACKQAPAWMQPAMAHIRECAKQELAAEWTRFEKLEDKVGISRMNRRSDEVDALRGPHFDLIENADGSSPIIIAAKLDCALSHLSGDEDLSDCGPSGIASAIRGLLPELPADMAQTLAPIAAGEGKVRDTHHRRRGGHQTQGANGCTAAAAANGQGRKGGAVMTSQQSFDAALHQILTLLFKLRRAVQEQTQEIAALRAELQPAPSRVPFQTTGNVVCLPGVTLSQTRRRKNR
jgi:hypothetical protein